MKHWGRRAAQLVKQAASSEAGKKAAGAVGTAVAGYVSKEGVERFAMERNKRLAIDLARQVGGQYSERTVVDGRRRYVVWKDGTPIEAFPRLQSDLAVRPELQSVPPSLLKSPPPAGG